MSHEIAPQLPSTRTVTDNGKLWAIISYASLFIGVPVCLAPLVMRDDAFALYHAKHATAIFGLTFVLAIALTLVTFVTCGLGAVLFVALFLPMISAVHGIVIALNAEWREPALVFGLGEKLFQSITVKG
jgi:hypothetical protein